MVMCQTSGGLGTARETQEDRNCETPGIQIIFLYFMCCPGRMPNSLVFLSLSIYVYTLQDEGLNGHVMA